MMQVINTRRRPPILMGPGGPIMGANVVLQVFKLFMVLVVKLIFDIEVKVLFHKFFNLSLARVILLIFDE
jgi:hypothetical protein